MSSSSFVPKSLGYKQINLNVYNLPSIWQFLWQGGNITLYSLFYSQCNQACLPWNLLLVAIFTTAQFGVGSQCVQAALGLIFYWMGIVPRIAWTRLCAWIEHVSGFHCNWSILMLIGLVPTGLSIFLRWGSVLTRLGL